MKIIIFVGFCLIGFVARSQSLERSVTATSGNYFYQAGTGSLSFTSGENVVITLIATNNILTQGFQQSDSSATIFVLENDLQMSLNIFPNPVSDFLSCKVNERNNFQFLFYDEAGRLISVPQQKSDLQIIFNVSKLAEGFYTLSVTDTEKKTVALKTFVKQ